MAFDKDGIEKILERVAQKLDISDKLFEVAREEYDSLGEWIDKKVEEEEKNYEVEIYQQGSFALGTVIKPITDKDDYDLDILCEMKEDYGIDAYSLKRDVVKGWLENYREIRQIEEKRRGWHVEYEQMPHFHMDVIPSVNGTGENNPIKITDWDKRNNTYEYVLSNPYGYRCWFQEKCKSQMERIQTIRKSSVILSEAEIEPLRHQRILVPLQRSIQLLKRHRDIMFESRQDKDDKPISIIITTLVGECCSNCNSIFEALTCFSERAYQFLEENKQNGSYYVRNPRYSEENFADKWNEKPIKAQIFYSWLKQVSDDFKKETLTSMNRPEMFKMIKKLFGENIGTIVINEMSNIENEKINNGELRIDTSTGMLSEKGSIRVRPNHHYHE